ncbi:MAG: DNA topoisomerase 3 [Bacteroides sp.]|nr:DNA topoisomerase 3 [Bacteroides sp.]MCM1531482.1 DNA topoisomerase 3 [Ruminococcus flavefaciens]MCM1554356.1 DNA topoisomerase 3 [Bacteroides sp.]
MKAVIAEKPSVAKDIANILGANARKDGYLEGNGYRVTWAFGHLVELAMPAEYGWEGFNAEHLPMIPDAFKLVPRQKKVGKKMAADPGVLKQLKVIKEVFNGCDEIVVATDAGREGELIFRYIYNYLHCRTPFRRLWISSLTDKAIKEGFARLRPGNEYDNLNTSAECRSQADWLVGLNASQALAVAAHGNYSLGRVQTPTLKMVCERYLENKNFVPQPYWQIKVDTEKAGVKFPAWSDGRYDQADPAQAAVGQIRQSGQLKVGKVERKEVRQEPPLLYDLTALQKEANTKLNFSADKTLSVAQSLYEKKVMSYPRTGSRYISEDVYEEMPERVALLAGYAPLARYAQALKGKALNKKSVDDKKVTDHHALIITENLPGEGALSADESKVYDLVASRMLEAFNAPCVKDATVAVLTSAGVSFTVRGSVVKEPGWRQVRGEAEEQAEDKEEVSKLPDLQEGDMLPVQQVSSIEKQTKPKPLHTESSLLAAMETAGKDIEDEEERAALKDIGIGTPATRAAVIETLFRREYMERQKKSLVPTAKGLAVYEIVKDKLISDVSMTGKWETALNRIADGQGKAEAFKGAIIQYTKQITQELLAVQGDKLRSEAAAPVATVKCPLCGGEVKLFPKLAKCTNEACDLKIWREIAGKKLSDKDLTALLTKGKTATLKGFKSKAGKKFDAALELKDGKASFVFGK